MEQKGEPQNDVQHATIFTEIVNSTRPNEDKSAMRLQHEAKTVVSAGTETTARALSVAMYHLLADRTFYDTLKAELVEAIPDPSAIPALPVLETLPYLTAVIAEGKSTSLPNTL